MAVHDILCSDPGTWHSCFNEWFTRWLNVNQALIYSHITLHPAFVNSISHVTLWSCLMSLSRVNIMNGGDGTDVGSILDHHSGLSESVIIDAGSIWMKQTTFDWGKWLCHEPLDEHTASGRTPPVSLNFWERWIISDKITLKQSQASGLEYTTASAVFLYSHENEKVPGLIRSPKCTIVTFGKRHV